MLTDTSIKPDFEKQQAQQAQQRRMLGEALAKNANTAFVVGPKGQQPNRSIEIYTEIKQQQQNGAILPMEDNARKDTQSRQYEAQKAALKAAKTPSMTRDAA